MSIKVGTVCYLTGDHGRAGECCIILSGPHWHNRHRLANGNLISAWVYMIELAGGSRTCFDGSPRGALRRHLIPIAPPGLTTDEDKRVPVAA